METSREPTVKSADRVLDLLELLCFSGHPMSHTEIAAALSIPKSSLSQLLANLERRGYLNFLPGPNVYELGSAIARLAEGSRSSSDFLQVAQNVVDIISKSTQETASFYKRRGDLVERVTVANSQQPLRYWMQVGEKMPLHATSGGKAILAAIEQSERERIVARLKLQKVTEKTLISRSALRDDLKLIAKTELAYSREEFEMGVIGISVAVLKADGHPEGSLSVVLPTVRDKPAHRQVIIDALRTAKSRLEAELGYVQPSEERAKGSRQRA
jgi:DNA-binding IclR family transcriptional regulator